MEFPITINSQEEFDQQISRRLERARQQWERESGLADTQRERDEARQRATRAERDALDRLIRRDARDVLAGMDVKDPKVQGTVLRLADFSSVEAGQDGEPNREQITDAIKAVNKDTPAIFGEGARVDDTAPEGGAAGSSGTDAPLTREQINNMSPSEINSAWDRISAFLSGERR